jgi:hypothetical protein
MLLASFAKLLIGREWRVKRIAFNLLGPLKLCNCIENRCFSCFSGNNICYFGFIFIFLAALGIKASELAVKKS